MVSPTAAESGKLREKNLTKRGSEIKPVHGLCPCFVLFQRQEGCPSQPGEDAQAHSIMATTSGPSSTGSSCSASRGSGATSSGATSSGSTTRAGTGALYSSTGISFWGGIDETTGTVIDLTHPLHAQCISDKVLVIPGGRGSCTGSQCMLELILNKKSPRALVLRDADAILCTGAVVAEEFFPDARDDVPIICAVGDEAFKQLVDSSTETLSVRIDEKDPSDVRIDNGRGIAITAKNLLRLPSTLNVDGIDPSSEAEALALRTIERVASVYGATELIPISNGHIDAVTYIGPGGLRFVQRLVELNGRVKVPTTLNRYETNMDRGRKLSLSPVYPTFFCLFTANRVSYCEDDSSM